MKTCSKCKVEKDESCFYAGKGRGGLRAKCIECMGEEYAAARRANPLPFRKRCNDYYQKNGRNRWLQRTYGITSEQYDAMLMAQGGRCAICPATEPGRGDKFFHIDHDHVTGEVRGLLCVTCNLGVGEFQDDPDILDSAAAYLREHQRPKLEVVNG